MTIFFYISRLYRMHTDCHKRQRKFLILLSDFIGKLYITTFILIKCSNHGQRTKYLVS